MKHPLAALAARSLFGLALLTGVGSLSAAPKPAAATAKPASEGLWQLQSGAFVARPDLEKCIPTTKFQAFTASLPQLRAALAGAPLDINSAERLGTVSKGNPVELSLPMPRDGKLARFLVEEVSMMEPALAARYPQIKTYRGTGIDDPAAQLALDVTPAGFHAQILSPSGRVYISPYYYGGVGDVYASYYHADAVPTTPWVCEFKGLATAAPLAKIASTFPAGEAAQPAPAGSAAAADRSAPQPQLSFGGSLRTYRLAVAANHQYVTANGGTTDSALAAIVVVMNRVSAIYEGELSIRLVLIANETAIIYPSAAGDPFTANDTTVISSSTATISAAVGAGSYDIGHVFTTGSGGVSGLGVVCNTSTKGRSTTGLPTPYGDDFSVDFVAHEMGHEFGGNHTFNSNTGNCGGGNRSTAHAYEPGSGSSIMAYAGICHVTSTGVTSDLQPHSDSMFHHESLREILTFAANTTTGGACPVTTTNTNTIPVINSVTANTTIPIGTPFSLTADATDADGDRLTYSWEERDLGGAQAGVPSDNGLSPIFRTFEPVYDPTRTFPKMSDIVNNTSTIGEVLPSTARTLNFRLTVRDNRTNGGATNSADMALTVTNTAGPFLVTAPNTALTVAAGGQLPVTWNVANTNVAPVNVANVNVLLSTDGGYTYPYTLATGVPNNGSASVALPAGVRSTTARIKVAAVGNIFFDISNANFTIQ